MSGAGAGRVIATPLGPAAELLAPVGDVIVEAARRWPDAPFLASRSHPAESVTFGQLHAQARRVAAHLVRAGVRPGEAVALLAENRPRWCAAHAGVLLAGGVVVPIDAQATAESLATILGDAGCRQAIVSAALAPRAAQAAAAAGLDLALHGLDDLVAHGAAPWSVLQRADGELPACTGGDRPAALIYTSGTTARAKGCVLTHANFRHELAAIRGGVRLTTADRILLFLPLHHVLAQVGTYLAPASIGMRVVHATVHRPEDLTGALVEGGVTVLLAVPQLFHLLHDRIFARLAALPRPVHLLLSVLLAACRAVRERTGANPGRLVFGSVRRALGPRLRLLVSGGAALEPRVQRDFLGLGFTLIQAYGLTETSGGALADRPERPRAGCVGVPLPGVAVRVHEPDREGVGEVCIAGGLVTAGYHRRPEATAELLRDGWLFSGDLGRLDPDGRLVLVGRRKEIIVLGTGENVNPEEVEAHHARSPWIRELCVMAAPRAGGGRAGRTEKLHAVVVPEWERFRREGTGNVRELIRFELQERSLRLPSHLRIGSFELRRDDLPRTTTRKLQRFRIAAGQDQATAEPEEAPALDPRLDTEEGRRLASIVRARAGAGALVRSDSHLELDLGLDSLERMDVVLALQSDLGLVLADEEIAAAATVGDLLDLAAGRSGGGAGPSSWTEVLAEAGPHDLPRSVRGGRGPLRFALLWLLVRAVGLAFLVFWRLRVEGREHLPAKGPVLVCPNHVSFLDGFAAGVALPARLARGAFVLGEASHVSRAVIGPLARLAGVVPVDPARHLRRALRAGAAGLKRGMTLLIFPEGERSADGTLGTVKPGAPILSAELGVPIVPAVIEGAHEAWPRGRRLPRPGRIVVRFGAPLDPRAVVPPGASAADAHLVVAQSLRRALLDLGARPAAGDAPGAPS